ncbi:MAG: 23S rRNA (pseudouridine(1915)-N(3))-methyltransferase RlmH [Bacteroidetes bacterium]|nr:23S rRNA (pseudouridine(1915)-N(3))-methyltransferase RlmH [Bacteroidota bacterium]
MKIKVILLGKTADESIRRIEADYDKRIKRYISFEYGHIDNAGIKGTEAVIKQKEGELILKKLAPSDHLILMDEKGKTYTSVKFADEVARWMNTSIKTVVLVIGGAYGFSEEVRQRANSSISLSAMTFSHQIVRVILLEQIYRAFTILNNEPYHHA